MRRTIESLFLSAFTLIFPPISAMALCPDPVIYSDTANGSAGHTLPGHLPMAPGVWQSLEDAARDRCRRDAESIVFVEWPATCERYCSSVTISTPTGDQSMVIDCLPALIMPPLPPQACSNVTHRIDAGGGTPAGSGTMPGGKHSGSWFYNFGASAGLMGACQCVPEAGETDKDGNAVRLSELVD